MQRFVATVTWIKSIKAALGRHNGMIVANEEGKDVFVVLRPSTYRLLKAAANCAEDPEALYNTYITNKRFQEGKDIGTECQFTDLCKGYTSETPPLKKRASARS